MVIAGASKLWPSCCTSQVVRGSEHKVNVVLIVECTGNNFGVPLSVFWWLIATMLSLDHLGSVERIYEASLWGGGGCIIIVVHVTYVTRGWLVVVVLLLVAGRKILLLERVYIFEHLEILLIRVRVVLMLLSYAVCTPLGLLQHQKSVSHVVRVLFLFIAFL